MASAIVYVRCCDCGRKGAYRVPGRPVLRCKYCRSIRHLSAEEESRVEANLRAVMVARTEEAPVADSRRLVEDLPASV